jgi:diguanylate cyclase (GGDEF)-like protein
MFGRLPLGIAVIDAEARLLFWNEQAAALFGIPPQMARTCPFLADVLAGVPSAPPRQSDRIVTFAATQIEAGDRAEPDSVLRLYLGRDRRITIQIRGLGSKRWMLVIDDGTMAAAGEHDGTARAGDAWLDPLTGLSNRRHFNRVLREMTGLASPEATHTLLMIDLDRFAAVNDTLGHPVGDALLSLVARRLRRATRDQDLVVRLGGDEFAILIGHNERGEPLADRVLDTLSRPFLVEGNVVNIGASIGIARCAEADTAPGHLVRCAELALYEAKSAGRGTWRAFGADMAARTNARRDMETGLRNALTMGGLSLAYQPQLDPRTQALTGFEALLRWHHPTLGDVSPATFIPLAEETACIDALSAWSLNTACQEAMRWPAPLSIVIRVSAPQMEDTERLAGAVHAALKASGLPPERLRLALTANAAFSKDADVQGALDRLRASGICVCMDEPGPGSVSLIPPQSRSTGMVAAGQHSITGPGTESAAAGPGSDPQAAGPATEAEAIQAGSRPGNGQAAPENFGPPPVPNGSREFPGIQAFRLSLPIQAAEIAAFLSRFVPAPDSVSPPR